MASQLAKTAKNQFQLISFVSYIQVHIQTDKEILKKKHGPEHGMRKGKLLLLANDTKVQTGTNERLENFKSKYPTCFEGPYMIWSMKISSTTQE